MKKIKEKMNNLYTSLSLSLLVALVVVVVESVILL